eukprot:6786284-Pyramimonas_sp.AAC.1
MSCGSRNGHLPLALRLAAAAQRERREGRPPPFIHARRVSSCTESPPRLSDARTSIAKGGGGSGRHAWTEPPTSPPTSQLRH